jgi:hypothetical protein
MKDDFILEHQVEEPISPYLIYSAIFILVIFLFFGIYLVKTSLSTLFYNPFNNLSKRK